MKYLSLNLMGYLSAPIQSRGSDRVAPRHYRDGSIADEPYTGGHRSYPSDRGRAGIMNLASDITPAANTKMVELVFPKPPWRIRRAYPKTLTC